MKKGDVTWKIQGRLALAVVRELKAVMKECGGNRVKAAVLLGVGERTLYRMLRRYGLEGESR